MLTPLHDVRRTFATLDAFQRSFLPYRTSYLWAQPSRPQSFRSAMDDQGDSFVYVLEVPGCGEKDLQLEVTGGALSVAVTRPPVVTEGQVVCHQERELVQFTRTWSFPVPIDPAAAKAELKDGVLRVVLPKSAELRPRNIPVSSS